MRIRFVSYERLAEMIPSSYSLLWDWSPETSQRLADISNYEHMQKLRKALRRCIREDLTPKQREAIIMYWFKGMTQEQIAKKLGISKMAVCYRLEGAMKKIKKHLQFLV